MDSARSPNDSDSALGVAFTLAPRTLRPKRRQALNSSTTMTTRSTRRFNIQIWAGCLVALFSPISYFVLFYRWPLTRDFPWANYLLFAIGGVLISSGIRRAFRQPDLYRGKIAGTVLASISLLLLGLFVYVTGFATKELPASKGAPGVGTKAPDFSLTDEYGNSVTLSSLLTTAGVGDPSQGSILGAATPPKSRSSAPCYRSDRANPALICV